MKLTVTQNNLAKAISLVSRVASARPGLPILADVLLQTSEGMLTIAGSNFEVAITSTIHAQVDEAGAIAVPAKLLSDFVGNLPHTNVNLETDGNKLKVSAAGFRSTINSNAAEEYPALPEPATENDIVLPTDKLKKSISGTVIATSNDTTRPILTGVDFYAVNGEAFLAATDGYRLAESKIMDTKDDFSMIIPAKTLTDIIPLLNGTKEITVRYNDEQVSFTAGETCLTSRLIDGRFIGYKRLLPGDTNFQIKVNRTELIKITKMAQLFARVTSGTVVITGNPAEKTLEVRSIVSQLGNNSSSIDAEFLAAKGDEDCIVNLNSKYLLDALNCLDGDSAIIKFNGKMTPVLLLGEGDGYKHMVMPVKA